MPQFSHGIPHPKDFGLFTAACKADVEVGTFDLSAATRAQLGREMRFDPGPALELCAALVSKQRFAEAELLYADLLAIHPTSERLLQDWAECAVARGDWTEAARRQIRLAEEFPHVSMNVVRLCFCLNVIERKAEANERLVAARRKFPNDLRIALEYAGQALAIARPAVALERYIEIGRQFPRSAGCVAGQAEALLGLGRFKDAEALLDARREEFGHDYFFGVQSAWAATRLENWSAAFQFWADCLKRFPGQRAVSDGLGQTLQLWRMATAGTDQSDIEKGMPPEIAIRAGVAPALPTPVNDLGVESAEPAPASPRDLMMLFEGLGNLCEFGLVQRNFGAEPMGLLRWSNITAPRLAELLTRRFEGVGDADNLTINVQHREYLVGDGRYFEMHTFIHTDHITAEALKPKMAKRMRFLARKLLDDLDEGSKIFVHKSFRVGSTDEDLETLSHVLTTRFPAATLLALRVADQDHAAGSVSFGPKGIMIGYLSRFARHMVPGEIPFADWEVVCTHAAALWRQSAAAPPPRIA